MIGDKKDHLLIVQIEPPQKGIGGDFYYRTYAPGLAMSQEQGIWVVTLTNVHRKRQEIMSISDILILKNISDPDLLPLVKKRRSDSKITVYEIADDLGSLQPWNPVYAFFNNADNLSPVYHLARSCDALQVTVPELQQLYGYLNPNCIVFPNQILNIPPERRVSRDDSVVIGWGGSHGHLEDMAEIAPSLILWINQQRNVHLHLMCSDTIWRLFDDIPDFKKKRTLPGSLDDYYRFLAEIDIGIAPLKDTAFNKSRSDVKFLEYAVSGVVPVMARLEPYTRSVRDGRTGFLYSDINECLQTLENLIKDPFSRHKISKSAREYVIRERHQLQHAGDRIDFYRYLMRNRMKNAIKGSDGINCFQEWSRLDGAVQEGRYLNLLPTHFEMLLHDGLVAMQMNDDGKKANECFTQASRLEPNNYLPYLFGARISPDPIQTLHKAIDRMPQSLKARILLGQEYSRKGEIKAAFESFDSAALICPDFDIPYLKAASLLKSIGQEAHSRIFLEKAALLKIPSPLNVHAPSQNEINANTY